ncbi:MAG: hypothetical protein Q4D79_00760 [Propionibacteriaceae bacterium]|nr:hypothetical protein [Propionibacteriaceae bacterium]
MVPFLIGFTTYGLWPPFRLPAALAVAVLLGDELQHVAEVLRVNRVRVTIEGEAATVTGPIAVSLGWVLREAATNVLRHANASRVRIQFEAQGFTFEDDGNGPGLGQGNGVPGMRLRVAAADGDFSFGPAASRGSAVRVTW